MIFKFMLSDARPPWLSPTGCRLRVGELTMLEESV
jgi:hypothetical protein